MNVVEKTLNFLRRRKHAYQLTFGTRVHSPAQAIVLEDLAKFCRATEDTMSADPHKTAYLAGRRSVFLRLNQHLHMSPEELLFLYGSNSIAIQGDDQ